MRALLPILLIWSMLLGSCASQKDACPGEVVVREKARYTPLKTSSDRAIKNMAKPSLIYNSKSHGGRKPPKSTIYTAKSNSSRRPPK